jgi:hypothetical protein
MKFELFLPGYATGYIIARQNDEVYLVTLAHKTKEQPMVTLRQF